MTTITDTTQDWSDVVKELLDLPSSPARVMLAVLEQSDGLVDYVIQPTGIAERLDIKPASVRPLLEELAKRGLVARDAVISESGSAVKVFKTTRFVS
jgi:predicted transcriptional regulator